MYTFCCISSFMFSGIGSNQNEDKQNKNTIQKTEVAINKKWTTQRN